MKACPFSQASANSEAGRWIWSAWVCSLARVYQSRDKGGLPEFCASISRRNWGSVAFVGYLRTFTTLESPVVKVAKVLRTAGTLSTLSGRLIKSATTQQMQQNPALSRSRGFSCGKATPVSVSEQFYCPGQVRPPLSPRRSKLIIGYNASAGQTGRTNHSAILPGRPLTVLPGLPLPSFPRKRESGGGLPGLRHHKTVPFGIPAYAGMTFV